MAAPPDALRVVITGASSGLGAALARAYAAPGCQLGLTGRNPARLDAVVADCRAAGADIDAAALDVGDPEAMGRWLADFAAAGPVDIVIANAGISGGPKPGSLTEGVELATRQIRTNLLGVINTIEPLLPAMIERGQGRIAIVSSVAGYRGLPYSPGYSASKAGARMYGESLRGLVSPAGLSVTVICPGFFSSPMTDRWKGPTPFLFTLEKAVFMVRRGIDRGQRRVAFPWPLVAALRMADLIPAGFGDIIMRANKFHINPP